MKRITSWVYAACCLILTGASASSYLGRGASPAASEAPTLLLVNGVIYTGNAGQPSLEAIAIRGEEIVAVGSTPEMRKLAGTSTRVVDLQGRFVMPGFNDAHIHLASGGQSALEVDLSDARSIGEVQQRIRARLKDTKPGEWVTGRGWDHTLWPEKRFPTRRDLDELSRQHPMVFRHVSGHVAVANSRALELAGISKQTKDPPGGEIERDTSGEPTGMLKEGPAMSLVYSKLPPLDPERRRRGIELALAEAARFGVTSVQDNSSWEDFLVYEQLKKEGKLTVRVTEWLPFAAPLAQLEQMRRYGTTDPWLRTGALKAVTDGALGSRTAALLEAYADGPANKGILIHAPDELKAMAIERDNAGFQLAFHAIGDRANRITLDVFEAVRAANGSRDRRLRVEHAQVVAPEDFSRFAKLEVVASMQPCHESTDMRWAEARLGPERSKGAYAWKTMARHGVRLAFGTDYPVEPINPMRGLYACVTRELPGGGPPGSWQPQEKISLDACIRAYTAGSAYAEFAEGKKGRIAPGQWADFIVLSADVTRIRPQHLQRTEVLQTFVGGRLVYQKK